MMAGDDSTGLDALAIVAVAERLECVHGRPVWHADGTVLDGLIATILSQSTTSGNARRAMERYRQRFPTPAAALAAGPAAIEEAIRPAGLAAIRAPRIHAILQRAADCFGDDGLEPLREWPDDQVAAWLRPLPGVGVKTIACVLLFVLGREVFPVDTHVHRLAGRLGWVAPGGGPDDTYAALGDVVPAAWRPALHLLLIRHGREVCRARRPRCEECVLASLCPTAPTASSLTDTADGW